MSNKESSQKPKYKVPALEKGLEVLEFLAGQSEGLTQTQIAQGLHRSSDSLFRVFVCLEEKGYIYRQRPGDTLHLTSRLYTLAHKNPPTQRLIDAAMPLMRELSKTTHQSCHLSLPSDGMLVVAQVDAPDSLGFAVRRGTLLDVATSSSGMVYRAFAEDADPTRLPKKLEQIRQDYGLKNESTTVRGITDLCAPILDHRTVALAVLCVPYVSFLTEGVAVDEVMRDVQRVAKQISETQGWQDSSAYF